MIGLAGWTVGGCTVCAAGWLELSELRTPIGLLQADSMLINNTLKMVLDKIRGMDFMIVASSEDGNQKGAGRSRQPRD
jgi:hypothetical protein